MTADESPSDIRDPDEPNLRPGPQDLGGQGGMATREQEQRVYEENRAGGARGGGPGPRGGRASRRVTPGSPPPSAAWWVVLGRLIEKIDGTGDVSPGAAAPAGFPSAA